MYVQLYKKVSSYFIFIMLACFCLFNNATAQTSTLIHFWSFNYFDTVNVASKGIPYTSSTYTGATNNNSNPSIKADYSIIDTNKAVLAYKWQAGTSTTYGGFYDNYPAVAADFDTVNARTIPGYNTGTLTTIQGIANANNCFRDRAPADKSYLLFYIPSTGYQNLIFSYGVESSNGTNCKYDTFYYSIDSGVNFIQSGLSKTWDSTVLGTTAPFTFKKITVNITDPLAINNPKLVFKVTVGPVNSGNNRFDNVSLDGTPIITINSQPVSSTIGVGNNTSFSVSATGTGTLSYQWQVNTGTGFTNITNGGVYSNATTSTLNITGATLAMNGYQYQCIVTNSSPAYSVTTNTATLWTYIQVSKLIHYWNFNNFQNAPSNDTVSISPLIIYNFRWSAANCNQTVGIQGAANVGYLPMPTIKADYSAIDTNKTNMQYVWLPGTPTNYWGFVDNVAGATNNARAINGVTTGAGLGIRNRNPSGKSYLTFNIPSTGYQNLVFTYDVQSSSTGTSTSGGANNDTFAYSIDSGATWVTSGTGLSEFHDTAKITFNTVTINITDPAAYNNSKLMFKIWQGTHTGDEPGNTAVPSGTAQSGNDRYDNVTLDGYQMVGANTFASSLSGTSPCFPSLLSLTSAMPPLQVIWQNNGSAVATVLPNNNTNASTIGGTGVAGSGLTQLAYPTAVQRDLTGNIYICDQANNRVVKWSSPFVVGVVVAGNGTAGSGLTQLSSPQQIYVDASANVWVADKGNSRVVKWSSPYTTGTVVAGQGGQGTSLNQLNGPTGIWVDGSNNLFIADSGNSRIMKYTSGAVSGTIFAGNGLGSTASQLNSPIGITGDASGNIYVADKGNNRIQQFPSSSSAGTNATTIAGSSAGTSGNTADKLNSPVSVRLDIGGFLYITDQGNNRIQRWVPGGAAGTTLLTYSTGSSATQLNNPYDAVVDSSGNLYVADYNNNRVQKFGTTNTYTPTAPGSYTAIVTSAYGTSTTAPFVVAVPPTVTANPANTTICQGTNTTLTSTATGGSLSPQWQVNTGSGFTNIANGGVYSGATTSNLTITGALATMTGYVYQCVYTNPCTPAATTTSATLTVTPTPAITTQPVNTSVCNGGNTILSTTATGAGLTYQWRVNSGSGFTSLTNTGVYTGATTNTLVITGAITSMNTYQYQCVVSGTCTPPATTTSVVLTVNTAPAMNTQPTNSTICQGLNTTFGVAATGAGLTYQWQVNTGSGYTNISNGGVYSNATTNTLSITGATALMNTYLYQCVISGTCTPAITSNPATLTVNASPNITTQPANSTICAGGNTSFTVVATGAGLSYQWYLTTGSGFSTIGNFGFYSGATTPTLTLTGVGTGQSGLQYFCVISGTCTPPATTANALLTVNPNPSLTSNLIGTSACNSTAIAYIPVSSLAGTSYSWSRAIVTNITPATGSGTGNISETLTNSSSSPVVITYAYTLTANGCSSSQNITDTVFPSPTVTAPLPQTVCNGTSTAAITFSGSAVTGTSYNWANNTTSIGLAATGSGNIAAFTATNSTTSAVTGTITVTPQANGCNGTPQNFTISVNPTPTVGSIPDQTVCNGSSTSLISINGPVSGTTFSWANNTTSIGLAATGSGNIAAFTATNATTSPVTGTITITPTANACIGTTRTFNITVNPTPTAILPPNQVFCNGVTTPALTFSGSVTGTTYNWSTLTTSIGLAANGTGNILPFTATNSISTAVTGTVSVTPTANSCAGSTQTFTITVDPTPGVILPLNQVVCNGATTSALSFTSSVGGTTYSWTNNLTSIGLAASGSGNIAAFTAANTGNTPAIATIAVTPSASGCIGSPQNFIITVNPTPSVTTPSNQTVCNGAATIAASFTGSVSGTTYNWTNNTASIGLAVNGSGTIASFTALNTTTAPVTGTITVTPAANSCTGISQNFTITVNPTPVVTLPVNQVVCNGATVSALAFSGAVSGTTYSWTNNTSSIGLGTGGTGNIASFNATNITSAPVVATVSVTPTANSCTGTAQSFTITVNPTPSVIIPSNQVVCNGAAASALSFSGPVSGSSYSWANNTVSIGIGGGGTGNISSFIASNTTSSPVVATILVTPSANSCTGTSLSFTITVNPTPGLTAPGNQVVCNGSNISPIVFTGSLVNNTNYNWTNNTTSIGLGASGLGNIAAFAATNNTTASVTSTITVTPIANSCSGTPQSFTITVYPTPVLNSPLTPMASCSNAGFVYTPGSATSGSSFSWSRAAITNITPATGSGTSGINEALVNATPNPVVVNYVYTLSANGCTNTQIITDTVKPMPVLSSSVTPLSSCSNSAFSYIPGSATAGTIFTWSRAGILNITPTNGSGSGNINETLVNTTPNPIVVTYLYTMTSNGCSNTQAITDTVKPTPNLSSVTLASICDNTLLSYAPGSATNNATFTWSRGAVPGISPATASGTGPISEVLSNGTANPIVVSYVYSLSANGCSNIQNVTDTVKPMPVLNSSLLPPAICNNAAFNYIPTSATQGTVFAWTRASIQGISNPQSAGSGNPNEVLNDTSANAVVVTYTYSLSANGCTNPNTFDVKVTVDKQPGIISQPNPSTICAGSSTTLSFTATGTNTTYQWMVDTGTGYHNVNNNSICSGANTNTLTLSNVPFSMNGYVYQCVVSGACLPSVYTSPVSITVNTLPAITSQPPASVTICAGGNTSFATAASGTGISYQWMVNTNGSSYNNVPNNTVYSGATTPTLSVNGATQNMGGYLYKCMVSGICTPPVYTNAITFNINPNPQPIVQASGPLSFCTGSSVNLYVNPGTNYSYQWKQNGSNISGAVNASYTITTSGTYSLVVTNNFGCVNTSSGTVVTVNSYPSAPINNILGNLNFCQGDSVMFGTSTNFGQTYQWKNNNNIIPGATNPTYAAHTTGNYSVIVSQNGCATTSAALTVVVDPVPADSLILTGHPVICSGGSGTYLLSAIQVTGQTYQWYINGIADLGASSFQFPATLPGWYNVKITNTLGCSIFTQSVYVAAITSPAPVITAQGIVLEASYGSAFASYQWYYNGTSIAGADSAIHTATQNGYYTVTVTDSNGCSGSSSQYQVNKFGVGVANVIISAKDVRIYPNPATSVVHIEAPVKLNATIVGMDGKMVLQQDDAAIIDISQLPNGVYAIQLHTKEGVLIKTERLVKNNW